MNTIATEVTMFSGLPDGGPARPGAGPSLAEWWSSAAPDEVRDHAYGLYAPRSVYGRYLRFVLDTIDEHLGERVRLVRVTGEVTQIRRHGGGYRVDLSDGGLIHADRVVLATGQPRAGPEECAPELASAALESSELGYYCGDSTVGLVLDAVSAGEPLGIIGLGLTFYDIVAALTSGRGGRFAEASDGRLVYCPTGREPLVVAGSRSGLPFPARGRNQKPSDHRYRPRLLTADRIAGMRQGGRLDFTGDLFPWILAEVHLVYFEVLVRSRYGARTAEKFVQAAVDGIGSGSSDPVGELAKVATGFGLRDESAPVLERLARPFAQRFYDSPSAFRGALKTYLEEDLREALGGNVANPLKAALDTLRDIRGVVRGAVEFGGLTPGSYRDEFLGYFAPAESLLSAGPPLGRVRELLALIDAGLVDVVGPDVRVRADPHEGRYVMWSPRVRSSHRTVRMLIDCRIPKSDINRDGDPLIRQLRLHGLIRSHVIADPDSAVDTGGVDVTGRPFHPIQPDGRPDPNMYVLGLPTEGTRWYTQIGSGRPGFWNDFIRDADSVAADLLTAIIDPGSEA